MDLEMDLFKKEIMMIFFLIHALNIECSSCIRRFSKEPTFYAFETKMDNVHPF